MNLERIKLPEGRGALVELTTLALYRWSIQWKEWGDYEARIQVQGSEVSFQLRNEGLEMLHGREPD